MRGSRRPDRYSKSLCDYTRRLLAARHLRPNQCRRSVAFLVNSKLTDDCVSKLDFATRTAYLAKLKEGFSNNAGATMDVKK